MDYLIIGDIHGHGDALRSLLAKAGFSEIGGAWRNSGCRAVFVGDLIDRGPEQLEVVNMVRRMVDADAASICLGNHEFNAIGWATEDRAAAARGKRKHYRIRGSKNLHQHKAFLDAVGNDSPLHKEVISWFSSLPMWLEFEDFRVVHACWHPEQMALLAPHVDDRNVMTEDGLHEIFKDGTDAYEAAEIILKGLEIELPEGVSFFDKDGVERRKTRIRWWNEGEETYRSSALVDDETAMQIPNDTLPAASRVAWDGGKPVFFGHYWMSGTPHILSDNKTCLDFSIAKDGVLAGYILRDGDLILSEDNLMWVGDGRDLVPGLTA